MNAPTEIPSLHTLPTLPEDVGIRVAPLLSLPPDEVQYYFQRLYVNDTLRFRFSDLMEPTWSDVVEIIQRMGNSMYLVTDESGDILAEFTLENFTGRAAQSHFSTSPDIDTKRRIAIGRFAAQYTLTRVNPESGEYWLDALYGLTPVSNRAACIFALKIGYKRQGILPSGMLVNSKPVDCMISVRTRDGQ